jgi:hypothetical protein
MKKTKNCVMSFRTTRNVTIIDIRKNERIPT